MIESFVLQIEKYGPTYIYVIDVNGYIYVGVYF